MGSTGSETARLHHAARRRGDRVAARGAGAACGLDGSPDWPSVPGNARTTAVRGQLEAFRQGLKEYGWVEGQNIIVEYSFAEGREDALPAIAAELARLRLDVIVAAGTAAIQAAKTVSKPSQSSWRRAPIPLEPAWART